MQPRYIIVAIKAKGSRQKSSKSHLLHSKLSTHKCAVTLLHELMQYQELHIEIILMVCRCDNIGAVAGRSAQIKISRDLNRMNYEMVKVVACLSVPRFLDSRYLNSDLRHQTPPLAPPPRPDSK